MTATAPVVVTGLGVHTAIAAGPDAFAAALRSLRVPPLRRSTARVPRKSSQATPSTTKPSQATGEKAVCATHLTTPVITRPTGTREYAAMRVADRNRFRYAVTAAIPRPAADTAEKMVSAIIGSSRQAGSSSERVLHPLCTWWGGRGHATG